MVRKLTGSNLYKSYISLKPGQKVNRVLKNVSLEIASGEIIGLVGLNGSGKTTLLQILGGLKHWDGGQVKIFDQVVNHRTFDDVQVLRDNVSVVISGEAALEGTLTTDEFIFNIFAKNHRSLLQDEKALEMFTHLFRTMKLDKRFLTQQIDTYSKGMKQKVHLIRAFLERPSFFLLDEPFIGLDRDSVNTLKEQLILSAKRGNGIVVTSHELEILVSLADKIVVLNGGVMSAPIDVQTFRDHRRSFRIFTSCDSFYKIIESGEKIISELYDILEDDERINSIVFDKLEALGVSFCFFTNTNISMQDINEIILKIRSKLESEKCIIIGYTLGCSSDSIARILSKGMS